MATYTGVADASGNFTVPFSSTYTSGEKITVTAEKDSATKSIELYAPSEVTGGGVIQFSGNMTNFPNNIGTVILKSEITNIPSYGFAVNSTGNIWAKATGLVVEGATNIGSYAFLGWSSLRILTLNSGLKNIGAYAFEGHKLVNLNIPASVETISSYAFNSAERLISITFETNSKLTSISEYAFTTAIELTFPLILPKSLVTIGSGAFRFIWKLKSLIIGPNVKTIGSSAFAGARVLEEMIIDALTPPAIASSTFLELNPACVIKVPSASLSAYQSALNWSIYASQMVGV